MDGWKMNFFVGWPIFTGYVGVNHLKIWLVVEPTLLKHNMFLVKLEIFPKYGMNMKTYLEKETPRDGSRNNPSLTK